MERLVCDYLTIDESNELVKLLKKSNIQAFFKLMSVLPGKGRVYGEAYYYVFAIDSDFKKAQNIADQYKSDLKKIKSLKPIDCSNCGSEKIISRKLDKLTFWSRLYYYGVSLEFKCRKCGYKWYT